MQLLQNAGVRYRRREFLEEEVEKRDEGTGHCKNVGHVLLLLLGEEEVLGLIRAPEIGQWRVIRPGKYRLSDVRKDKSLQEQPHAPGDGGSGAIDQHDLALILQLLEVRRGRAGKRQSHALRGKECLHSNTQRSDRLFAFLYEVALEIYAHCGIFRM